MTEVPKLILSAVYEEDATPEPPQTIEEWQKYANCLGVDPDLFFPERGASTKPAKQICSGCVVQEECLEYALSNGERFGVWGGESERSRRRLRRARAVAQQAMEDTVITTSLD